MHPQLRNIYAITTGDYVGEMFIYMREALDTYHFLSVPKMVNRAVPKDKFEIGWNSDIIELVETAPTEVYEVAVAQFNYNEDSNN